MHRFTTLAKKHEGTTRESRDATNTFVGYPRDTITSQVCSVSYFKKTNTFVFLMLMLMLMSSENRREISTNTSVRYSRALGTRLAVGNKMADEDFSSGSHFLSYIFFLSTHAYILMLMSLLS